MESRRHEKKLKSDLIFLGRGTRETLGGGPRNCHPSIWVMAPQVYTCIPQVYTCVPAQGQFPELVHFTH